MYVVGVDVAVGVVAGGGVGHGVGIGCVDADDGVDDIMMCRCCCRW